MLAAFFVIDDRVFFLKMQQPFQPGKDALKNRFTLLVVEQCAHRVLFCKVTITKTSVLKNYCPHTLDIAFQNNKRH